MRFLRLVGTLALLITLSVVSFSQEVQKQKSTEKVRIDGEIYYIHSVKKGETVYSLTKVYNISEDELLRTNPQLSDGLKDGQVLRIPEKAQQAGTQPKRIVHLKVWLSMRYNEKKLYFLFPAFTMLA